jgi:hypothetical protein
LQHGILACEIGFASAQERGSDTEYVKMLAALRKYFEPADIMEDLIVRGAMQKGGCSLPWAL